MSSCSLCQVKWNFCHNLTSFQGHKAPVTLVFSRTTSLAGMFWLATVTLVRVVLFNDTSWSIFSPLFSFCLEIRHSVENKTTFSDLYGKDVFYKNLDVHFSLISLLNTLIDFSTLKKQEHWWKYSTKIKFLSGTFDMIIDLLLDNSL